MSFIFLGATPFSGSHRFGRIRSAIESDKLAPPADLRYLRGGRSLDQTGESQKAKVVTFLEQVYQSQAETLPDLEDDPDAADMTVKRFQLNIGQEEISLDPYSEEAGLTGQDQGQDQDQKPLGVKEPKTRKVRKHCRSLTINPARLNEEVRYLPPGTMLDVYHQMKASDPDCTVSFAQFWRVWRQEYSHMKFRARSTHAICSVCLRYKFLIKDFGHHLRARAVQQQHYLRHLEDQFKDRCAYWRARASSRLRSSNEVCIIMDGMDQGKFAVPRATHIYRSKELNTLQRPRLHITGAIAHGHFVAFSISNADCPKDSSTMTEMLAHCITLLQQQGVNLSKTSLVLQTDNTPREFKNNPLLRFLCFLTANRIVDRASLRCLRTGHSHEDVDQVFGQLAGHLVNRVRVANTPDDFASAIRVFVEDKLKRAHEAKRYCFKIDQVRDWLLKKIFSACNCLFFGCFLDM